MLHRYKKLINTDLQTIQQVSTHLKSFYVELVEGVTLYKRKSLQWTEKKSVQLTKKLSEINKNFVESIVFSALHLKIVY